MPMPAACRDKKGLGGADRPLPETASRTTKQSPPTAVLVIILMLSAVGQMDSGIIPPALGIVQNQFGLDFRDKGILGASRPSLCLGQVSAAPPPSGSSGSIGRAPSVSDLSLSLSGAATDACALGVSGAMGAVGFVVSCPFWGVILGSTSDQRRLMIICAWLLVGALVCNSTAPDFHILLGESATATSL